MYSRSWETHHGCWIIAYVPFLHVYYYDILIFNLILWAHPIFRRRQEDMETPSFERKYHNSIREAGFYYSPRHD